MAERSRPSGIIGLSCEHYITHEPRRRQPGLRQRVCVCDPDLIPKQLKWIPTTVPRFWLQCILGVVVEVHLNVAAFILHFSILPGHYGMAGGQDLHNFLSSGFLTLGRGHLKGKSHGTRSVPTFLGPAK